ncbi:MAG: protoporphyrinogen oxidase [Acidimicrobiales bacterium]
MTTIAVVGGGITGLAAANELANLRPSARHSEVRDASSLEIVVIEGSERLGGRILTTPVAGRMVDAGADAFLARHPAGVELCRQLGVDDRLVSPAARSAYVYVDGALRPLPIETLLGVPTDLDAVARSGLLSPAGVQRAAADLDGRAVALTDGADVSVGELVRARLGDEVLERLVDPLVGGISVGDSDRLSVRATTPQLAEAAAEPSLIEGARALRQAAATEPGAPVFFGFPDGMGELVNAVGAALTAAGVVTRVGTPVETITPSANGGWHLGLGDEAIDTDAVVLAVPSFVAAGLVTEAAPDAAAALAAIEYASVVLVTLAVPAHAIGRPLDGSGFLVPRSERLLMTACSWASSKWRHLAPRRPDEPVLLRVSAGRAGDRRALELDADNLVATVLDELARTMSLSGAPLEVRVTPWPQSFPQYAVGHLDRVAAIETELADRAPGLAVAGAAYRGLGIPACIDQGRRAARSALDALAARSA